MARDHLRRPLQRQLAGDAGLEKKLQDAEDELEETRPQAVLAIAGQPIQAAPGLLMSLVGRLAIPLDGLLPVFGNAEACLISPAEIVLGI